MLVARSLLFVALVVLTAGVDAAAAQPLSSPVPRVLTQRSPAFQVKPAIIDYTGDGTGVIGGPGGTSVQHPGRLHWTVYNHHRARARGLVWINDCDPYCAAGTFVPYRVRVYMSRPRAGRFTRMTLKYTYDGSRVRDTRGIRDY